ncbi:MAG TPA: hypothetical protein VGK93_12770 [Candidatus Eisenbacteria bacterium]|jgi:hypothetical protein
MRALVGQDLETPPEAPAREVGPTSSALRRTVTVALLAEMLAGCGSGGGPTAPRTVQDLASLIASLVPAEFVMPSNVDLTESWAAAMDVESKRQAFALIQNSNDFVNAGDIFSSGRRASDPVAADEVRLDVRSTPVNGVAQYVYSTMPSNPSGIVLAFDDVRYHRFRITGSSRYPAVTDSVRSVIPLVPATPSSGATVQRSLGINVTWTAGADTTQYVTAMVFMNSDPTQRRISGVTRDTNGQLTLSGTLLSQLPAGSATLVVVRYRLRYVSSGMFKTGILSEAGDARPITLT